MVNISKCLLLPIDGSTESLRSIDFIVRLYPGARDVNLILSYFTPALPPIYAGTVVESPDLLKGRRNFIATREKNTRRVFEDARKKLIAAGLSEELMQEHVQQKEMTVAKHACLLADTRKVDAIVVQKKVSSGLEGFLKGDSPSVLLQHCMASPIWFTEGDIEDLNAAICVNNEPATLRVADHAAFMLAGTSASITLLHVSKSISNPILCGFSEVDEVLGDWAETHAGREVMPFLRSSAQAVIDNGVEESRIRTALVPHRRDKVGEILSWCRANGIGIIGLGHSKPGGVWSFLKASVTRKILSDFKNMAVWVTQ
ncbi:MAG: universal stress protein [Syntrophobacteraceae bacterium]